MTYQIEIRDTEPVRIAFMRYRGIIKEANKVFPNVFRAIRGKSNGAPFFLYHTVDRQTESGELDLCVPTAENPTGHGVNTMELPQEKAVCVVHHGSYETMDTVYSAIQQYAAQHNLVLRPPFREVFVKGPGVIAKGNPDKYITEIIFPIKED